MEKKEQTFEELMAELDEEASGLQPGPPTSRPQGADVTGATLDLDLDDSPSAKTKESDLDLATKPEGAKSTSNPASGSTGKAGDAQAPVSDEDVVLVEAKEEIGGQHDFSQQDEDSKASGFHEVKHALGSLWSKAKSKAEAFRHEEGRGEAAAKVSALWDKATDAIRTTATAVAAEAKATASDVAASARAMNSKILVKPQASFGVPLPLIAKRQTGDDDAPAVPLAVESVISMLEKHTAEKGALQLDHWTRPTSSAERDALKLLQERIDQGEDINLLNLEAEPRVLLSLLKLFLVEMTEPLLTYALYNDFLTEATPGGGAGMADVASLLPPSHVALARRLLPFLGSSFAPGSKPYSAPDEKLSRLGASMGVLMLRSKDKELRNCLLEAVQVRNASVALLQHCDFVFAHNVWFLRNWFGVYKLSPLRDQTADATQDGQQAAPEEGSAQEQGTNGETVELVVDVAGVTLGGEAAEFVSIADAGQWERRVSVPERVTVQMVASMRVADKTVTITFKGPTATGGVAELREEGEKAKAPEDADENQSVLRRLEGSYVRPLPWQDQVQKWGEAHTGVPWDEAVHPAQLQELWKISFEDKEGPARKDQRWGELGFQQQDPSTDFRGGGMLGLEVLLHFAKQHPDLYKKFLVNSKGATPTDGYPFACGAINVVFTLLDLLLLLPSSIPHQGPEGSGKEARTRRRGVQCRYRFGQLLAGSGGDAMAPFHALFLAAVKMLDKEWAASSRQYMHFNLVMASVRAALSNLLRSSRVASVADLVAVDP